jgi:hypothetical protein
VHFEGYGGARGSDFDGGVRARLVMPFARFGIGADYNALDGRTRLILSAFNGLRRGGVFGDGTLFRFDYLPARDHSITAGLEIPIYRNIPTGRARPGADHVRLTAQVASRVQPPDSRLGLERPLASARAAADRIRQLGVPFLGRTTPPSAPRRGAAPMRTIDEESRDFHTTVEHAFSIALAGRSLPDGEITPAGLRTAAEARTILLAEVLLPYNRLLGQVKKPDTIRGFGTRAQGIFLRWLHIGGAATEAGAASAVWVFAALLDAIEATRAATATEWRDTRFVWLPLQYALKGDQYDTQAELDAIVALAVEEPFTEGNFVSYVINEQFQYQLSRTIRAAEDYHVLWTHDFRGNDDQGDPDEMAYRQVLRSYLVALTERVRAYDRTGKFPVYIIMLDEWFYQVRNGRWWMNVLENPTGHRLRLASAFKPWEDSIAAAQAQLRDAIAGSTLLQAQRRQFGEEWLRNLVKVHVNITNPADPSFWSWNVVAGVPLGDNMLRDHRKLVFYDVTEADPYRGEALYTGAGIGENYANLSWEDRSLLVRGPAILGLKAAVRNLMETQGSLARSRPTTSNASKPRWSVTSGRCGHSGFTMARASARSRSTLRRRCSTR